jgi:nucleoid-associated protein YgaU
LPRFFFSGILPEKAEAILFSRQESSGKEPLLNNHSGNADDIPLSGQSSTPEEAVHSLKSESDAGEVLQDNAAEPATVAAATPVTPVENPAGKANERIILKQGQTLRLLALEIFGNREFWIYIYLENKNSIQNPNIVPIGTELIIPDPAHYNINASDPQSVRIAKEYGEKVFSRMTVIQNR